MTSGLDHRECADALAAYALGALSEPEATRVELHLSECRECRAELDWLRAGVDVLPASVPPIDPPPDLKTSLMAIVDAEAELLRAAGENADRLPPVRRRWWPSRWAASVALGVAATCVAVVLLVVALAGGGSGTRTISAETTLAGARASLQLRGTRAELVVRELPVPAPGYLDELWVKRGSAPPAPAGTFVLVSGSVLVEQPVRRGDVVMVTVEPGRGTSAPTTAPVIVAKV